MKFNFTHPDAVPFVDADLHTVAEIMARYEGYYSAEAREFYQNHRPENSPWQVNQGFSAAGGMLLLTHNRHNLLLKFGGCHAFYSSREYVDFTETEYPTMAVPTAFGFQKTKRICSHSMVKHFAPGATDL